MEQSTAKASAKEKKDIKPLKPTCGPDYVLDGQSKCHPQKPVTRTPTIMMDAPRRRSLILSSLKKTVPMTTAKRSEILMALM